jgi:hypothetical protein
LGRRVAGRTRRAGSWTDGIHSDGKPLAVQTCRRKAPAQRRFVPDSDPCPSKQQCTRISSTHIRVDSAAAARKRAAQIRRPMASEIHLVHWHGKSGSRGIITSIVVLPFPVFRAIRIDHARRPVCCSGGVRPRSTPTLRFAHERWSVTLGCGLGV